MKTISCQIENNFDLVCLQMSGNWANLQSDIFRADRQVTGGRDQTNASSSQQSTERRTHYTSKQFTLSCTYCGKLFKQKIDLHRHERKHTGERPFPCPVCPYRATVNCALQRHMLTHKGLETKTNDPQIDDTLGWIAKMKH